jgi:hypothetical protein
MEGSEEMTDELYTVTVKGPHGHVFQERFRAPPNDCEAAEDEAALAISVDLLCGARAKRLAHLMTVERQRNV